MDARIMRIAIGAIIGGAAGYWVGGLINEIIRLKELKETEPEEDYEDTEEFPQDGEDELDMPKQPKVVYNHNKKDAKNYAAYFKRIQARPELAALTAKYNMGVIKDDDVLTAAEMQQELDETAQEIRDEIMQDIENNLADPSIISEEDFLNNALAYEPVTLKYYNDDIVTDDQDNPLADPEKFLGGDALVSFGMLSNDPDVVYVRNRAKKASYEIIRTNRNYMVEEPRRRRRAGKEESNGEDDA